jgi:hypothetical protein
LIAKIPDDCIPKYRIVYEPALVRRHRGVHGLDGDQFPTPRSSSSRTGLAELPFHEHAVTTTTADDATDTAASTEPAAEYVCNKVRSERRVGYLMGENIKVVWTEFSNIS